MATDRFEKGNFGGNLTKAGWPPVRRNRDKFLSATLDAGGEAGSRVATPEIKARLGNPVPKRDREWNDPHKFTNAVATTAGGLAGWNAVERYFRRPPKRPASIATTAPKKFTPVGRRIGSGLRGLKWPGTGAVLRGAGKFGLYAGVSLAAAEAAGYAGNKAVDAYYRASGKKNPGAYEAPDIKRSGKENAYRFGGMIGGFAAGAKAGALAGGVAGPWGAAAGGAIGGGIGTYLGEEGMAAFYRYRNPKPPKRPRAPRVPRKPVTA
jgi:hypothetical protein